MEKSSLIDRLFYKPVLIMMRPQLKALKNLKMNQDQEFLFIKQITKQESIKIIIMDGNISRGTLYITSHKDLGRTMDLTSFCFIMNIF